jgi:hypothetical protein
MGIMYTGTESGRPRFPKEAETAKKFYWRTQDIYQEYREGKLSRDEALAKTIAKTNEYGPLIWGSDRSNIDKDYSESSKQLYWHQSEDEDL